MTLELLIEAYPYIMSHVAIAGAAFVVGLAIGARFITLERPPGRDDV